MAPTNSFTSFACSSVRLVKKSFLLLQQHLLHRFALTVM